MNDAKPSQQLEKSRDYIARKVQALRRERRWTQAKLSGRLDLSQSRLSEIERGGGSFTAEQFLEILKLFNVGASEFAPPPGNAGSALQNSLARLGALHLQESEDVLASERLSRLGDVVREALVASEFPRLITAVGPVLVRNIDRVNLQGLRLELAAAGLDRRLGWLVENTVEAIRLELPAVTPAPWRRLYNRARVVLEAFLTFVQAEAHEKASAPDVLDVGIRSKKTLEEVAASSSPISRRWGIVTTLQPEDFVQALRGARAADP
jgi:transcriptional regulator with XRE-family HTH domain